MSQTNKNVREEENERCTPCQAKEEYTEKVYLTKFLFTLLDAILCTQEVYRAPARLRQAPSNNTLPRQQIMSQNDPQLHRDQEAILRCLFSWTGVSRSFQRGHPRFRIRRG